jgi:hypothetical protein
MTINIPLLEKALSLLLTSKGKLKEIKDVLHVPSLTKKTLFL